MKKSTKILSVIILIISILIVSIILIFNIVTIIRIMFFGITVGSDLPDTIWWQKTELYGWTGIVRYYSVWSELVLGVEVPITIICIIYQIIYFKILRKKLT